MLGVGKLNCFTQNLNLYTKFKMLNMEIAEFFVKEHENFLELLFITYANKKYSTMKIY